jgi:hypothetical protein
MDVINLLRSHCKFCRPAASAGQAWHMLHLLIRLPPIPFDNTLQPFNWFLSAANTVLVVLYNLSSTLLHRYLCYLRHICDHHPDGLIRFS